MHKQCPECGRWFFGAGYTKHKGSKTCAANKKEDELRSADYIRVGIEYQSLKVVGAPLEKHNTRVSSKGVGDEFWVEGVYYTVNKFMRFYRQLKDTDTRRKILQDDEFMGQQSVIHRLTPDTATAEYRKALMEAICDRLDLHPSIRKDLMKDYQK